MSSHSNRELVLVLLLSQVVVLLIHVLDYLLNQSFSGLTEVLNASLSYALMGLGGWWASNKVRNHFGLMQAMPLRPMALLKQMTLEYLAIVGSVCLAAILANLCAHLLWQEDLYWQGGEGLGNLFAGLALFFNLFFALVIAAVRVLETAKLHDLGLETAQKNLELSRLREHATRTQLRALQARINPHFLYNALNSIASLVHHAPRQAEQMALALSRLFREALNRNEQDYTTVRQEIELVQTYLEIEKIRFADRLTYQIAIDRETEDYLIPRFLLQPLVENAVRHGLAASVEPGTISVLGRVRHNTLALSVRDTGPAFPDDLMGGYGLQNVQDSLRLLFPDTHDFRFLNTPYKEVRITLFDPHTYAEALESLTR